MEVAATLPELSEWTLTSFASNKTHVLELVDTPGHRKPSHFGHMISRSQESYPVSLKKSRLLKMRVNPFEVLPGCCLP